MLQYCSGAVKSCSTSCMTACIIGTQNKTAFPIELDGCWRRTPFCARKRARQANGRPAISLRVLPLRRDTLDANYTF